MHSDAAVHPGRPCHRRAAVAHLPVPRAALHHRPERVAGAAVLGEIPGQGRRRAEGGHADEPHQLEA